MNSFIQLLSRIIAHLLLTVVNRCGLADDSQGTSGSYGNAVAYHFISQILGVLFLHAEPVVIFIFVPLFEVDDQIYLLAFLYRRHTKEGSDVHDADASKLYKVSRDIRSRADEEFFTYLSDLHHVIGNETVASLYQLQRSFGFTDTAFACYQHAFAVYIHQYSVNGDTGCQSLRQPSDKLGGKLGGNLGHREYGNLSLPGVLQEDFIGLQISAVDKAGDIRGNKPSVYLMPALFRKLLHVAVLREADLLHTVGLIMLKIAGQLHTGTVDIRLGDLDIFKVYLRRNIFKMHFFDYFFKAY